MVVGIGIDYSNICKDYNTSYLDRDNTDPQTTRCMRQVLEWLKSFLQELTSHFDYSVYHLHTPHTVTIDEVASKRFLFYSLEKEITLQSFVVQKTFRPFASLAAWETQGSDSLLIQNDKDGEGIYFFAQEKTPLHDYLLRKLDAFSLEEVAFLAKS